MNLKSEGHRQFKVTYSWHPQPCEDLLPAVDCQLSLLIALPISDFLKVKHLTSPSTATKPWTLTGTKLNVALKTARMHLNSLFMYTAKV